MKRLVVASILLLILELSCNLEYKQKNLYFLENGRLMQLKSKEEGIDITPPEIDNISGGASLSPSGNYLAIGSTGGIYIVDIKTMETNKVTDFGYFPTWSSDEKWLIFRFQENKVSTGSDITRDRVYAINLNSNVVYTPDRLADNGDSTPSWLSPRSSLVYTANTVENVSYAPNLRRTGIYLYDPMKQSGYFILESDELIYNNPNVSPDGRLILYTLTKDFNRSLVLAEIGQDLRNYRVVVNPGEYFGLPLWSQDSRYFILGSFIYDSEGNKLREIKMDGWFINQMVWGNTDDVVYIGRRRNALGSASEQLVRYHMMFGISEVLYVTANSVYLLPLQ